MHTTTHKSNERPNDKPHDTPFAPVARHHDTPSAAAAPRYDIYVGIHKALRLFMTDTLAKVGAADPGDAAETDAAIAQLRDLLQACAVHIQDENEFVHPALERASPGASRRIAEEHVHHRAELDQLTELGAAVHAARSPARADAMARLYQALAIFVAENFEHMHYEESAHNALLWANYSDAELLDIEHAIVASIPPATLFSMLRWFFPAQSAPERAAMLRGMQAGMPPLAFTMVLDIARERLTVPAYARLARDLGLAPVPGLVDA